MNLVDGGALHDGIAFGMAKRVWGEEPIIAVTPEGKFPRNALGAARARFNEDSATATIPPEQSYLLDEHWKLVRRMLEVYRENYETEDYQIIQPECSFDVELPGSMHNCIWLHWVDRRSGEEYWGEPLPEMILEGRVKPAHSSEDTTCRCYTPHRVAGKTDAIVAWKNNIWLLEHKTNALQGEQFWGQWDLDIQPTIYIYGIKRSLNIRPSGFVLNAIHKPSESQVNSYNQRRKYGPPKEIADYISFERRPFLRSVEDLVRVEKQLIHFCEEWEWRIAQGYFDMSPIRGACMAYNRRCDYYTACLSHDEPGNFDALVQIEPDYIDVKRNEPLERIPA